MTIEQIQKMYFHDVMPRLGNVHKMSIYEGQYVYLKMVEKYYSAFATTKEKFVDKIFQQCKAHVFLMDGISRGNKQEGQLPLKEKIMTELEQKLVSQYKYSKSQQHYIFEKAFHDFKEYLRASDSKITHDPEYVIDLAMLRAREIQRLRKKYHQEIKAKLAPEKGWFDLFYDKTFFEAYELLIKKKTPINVKLLKDNLEVCLLDEERAIKIGFIKMEGKAWLHVLNLGYQATNYIRKKYPAYPELELEELPSKVLEAYFNKMDEANVWYKGSIYTTLCGIAKNIVRNFFRDNN